MKGKTILLVIALLVSVAVQGQRTEKVHAVETYKVTINENITLAEAQQRCINLARTKAIKEKFGELVASESFSSNVENNGELMSATAWESIISSAKGDWLGDTRSPKITVEYDDGSLYFTAEVWGEAREIVRARTDLDWGIVREGKKGRERTDNFYDGDRFFIDFQAPIQGYIAVYMVEEQKNGKVNCLLPDKNHTSGRYPVKASTRYWLFDKEYDPQSRYLKLTTKHETETSQFVLIFSPNPFVKCQDNSNGVLNVNSLSKDIFQKWLLKIQRDDSDMVVEKKYVKVVNDKLMQE